MKEEASRDEYIQAEVVEQVDFDKPKDPLWKRLLNRVRRTKDDDDFEAEVARLEALDDGELLAEQRASGDLEMNWEKTAGDRVLSKWMDTDPEVLLVADIARWADRVTRVRHEEVLGPYYEYARLQALTVEKGLQGGLFFRGDKDDGMKRLRRMARALREPGVDIDDHMPYPCE